VLITVATQPMHTATCSRTLLPQLFSSHQQLISEPLANFHHCHN